MRYVLFLLSFANAAACSGEWAVPVNPDPRAITILQEARADTRAQRYHTALAKYVWLHENAPTIEPTLYAGIRIGPAFVSVTDADSYTASDVGKPSILGSRRFRRILKPTLNFNRARKEKVLRKSYAPRATCLMWPKTFPGNTYEN